jgi:hypothetical protein
MDTSETGFLSMMIPDGRGNVGVLASPEPRTASRTRAVAFAGLSVSHLEILVLGAVGAAVSLALTGYRFGIINNLFHLPIVAALYDEPQFRHDTFIQALRYYSSGVWMLLDGSGRYVSPYWLFLGLDYLSRTLSFVAFLYCGSLLGVSSIRERVTFVVILCFSSLLQGYSYPGNGGLFVNYFSHSEIANGTILLTLYFAARGRFAEALTLNGVTFFINAFMAIWTIIPLGIMAALLLWRRELALRAFLLRVGGGLIIAGLFALPVLWNIVSNPDADTNAGVDFRRFLLEYYPDHVLFMIATPRHMVALATATVYGFACLYMLGERAAQFRAALWGSVLLYVVGIVLPEFTGLPLLLNFHLIRSSAVIQLMVALASASLATSWLCGTDRNRSKFFGPLLLLADCTWRSVLPLGMVAIAAAAATRQRGWRRSLLRLDYVVGAVLLLVIWPRLAWQGVVTNRAITAQTNAWTAVGDWARTATRPDAVFLIPTRPLPSEARPAAPTVDGAPPDPPGNSEVFEFASHRRVWVDFRQGAVVMWAPSYYATWRTRVSEVMALGTLADKLAYARQHDIDYVVDACRIGSDEREAEVFQDGGLCVFPSLIPPSARTGH